MKRTLLPLLTFIFMATQLLAFQHVATHGFTEHEHNGKPCEISVYYQQSQSFDGASYAPTVKAPNIAISAKQPVEAGSKPISFFAFKQPSQAPPQTPSLKISIY